MPISKYNKYFGGASGSAAKAKSAMMKEYGSHMGESVFYGKVNNMKKSKAPKNKKQVGGSNPMEGNSLPFQLGDGGRWIDDSRKMGKMHGKGK